MQANCSDDRLGRAVKLSRVDACLDPLTCILAVKHQSPSRPASHRKQSLHGVVCQSIGAVGQPRRPDKSRRQVVSSQCVLEQVCFAHYPSWGLSLLAIRRHSLVLSFGSRYSTTAAHGRCRSDALYALPPAQERHVNHLRPSNQVNACSQT